MTSHTVRNHSLGVANFLDAELERFKETSGIRNFLSFTMALRIEDVSRFNITKKLADMIEMPVEEVRHGGWGTLWIYFPNVFLHVSVNACMGNKNETLKEGTTHITLAGDANHLEKLYEKLLPYEASTVSSLTWAYLNSTGDVGYNPMPLEEHRNIHDEFYPWFEEGVDKYIDRFFESSANVLVLYGPPGTGKTNFIRHILHHKVSHALLTYEEKVMRADEFFISFIKNSYNLLIMEDSDVLLLDRENHHNGTMNKLLNISDGLVSLGKNKKIIFSANILNTNKIDSALTRPGRCFDIVNFRALQGLEVHRAREAAGLPSEPNVLEEKTLAEIFNGPSTVAKRRVGFCP